MMQKIFITYGEELTEEHIHNPKKLKWIMVISAGKTLLVLGIEREIARLAKCFGMNVAGVNRSGKDASGADRNYSISQLSKILPKADLVVSVLPRTVETSFLQP
jgi:phosphoglycerate dehydrogenase-like enzyme